MSGKKQISELIGTYACNGGEGGWAQATHCCWAEIDPQTGKVDITRYLVVEDCGTMINPAVVEDQVRFGEEHFPHDVSQCWTL
jgi:aerobic carbon-monoxide dehydrogenase large subunit